MKTILPLFLLLCSCSGMISGKTYRLPKVDERDIVLAEIKKNLHDTLAVQLNKQQISDFVGIVTDAPADIRKAIPRYWIVIQFGNDSVISYKVLDQYIGEKDWYVETDAADSFKKVYETSKKTKSFIPLK